MVGFCIRVYSFPLNHGHLNYIILYMNVYYIYKFYAYHICMYIYILYYMYIYISIYPLVTI